MNNNDQPSSLWDVISGNESLKLSISLDITTIVYIALGVFVVGIALIAISKSWPKR
ncbi:MAG: hypothetical protein MJZ72_07150 [Bacteroidales bacterium]|nr:hypothetical protein [Bacteroidales bacterium]